MHVFLCKKKENIGQEACTKLDKRTAYKLSPTLEYIILTIGRQNIGQWDVRILDRIREEWQEAQNIGENQSRIFDKITAQYWTGALQNSGQRNGTKCALDFRIHVEDRKRHNSGKADGRIVERKMTKYYPMPARYILTGLKQNTYRITTEFDGVKCWF
jgi:hypothetical protein